jgi:tight adherence protein B
MRRRLATALFAAAALAVLVTAAPAGADVKITSAGSARFPDRAFVLTLPKGATTSSSRVRVIENGHGVAAPALTSATATDTNRFGVILVIDASTSMKGAPLDGAIAAAKKFVAKRNPNQKIGIVTFNRTPTVLLAPTDSESEIANALSTTPSVAGGTRMYDATSAALDLLQQARISAGSVIVLSDGADNGSHATATEVGAQAQNDGARIYSVGLRDPHYDATSLTQLAAAGRGEYTEAGSAGQLATIYDSLASQIAAQYLLSYRSLEGPGQRVQIVVQVQGVGTATSFYATPALPSGAKPEEKSFWTSNIALVVVVLGAALLISMAIVAVVLLIGRRRRIETQMANFAMGGNGALELESRPHHAHGVRFVEGAERSLERLSWWPAFKEDVDVARIDVQPVKIAVYTAAGSVALLAFFGFAFGAFAGLVAAIAVPVCVHAYVHYKAGRQRRMFAEQLADNLQVIASAMRAGNSFTGALSVAARDAAEPTRQEFQRAITDEQLGIPFEDALKNVARRMENGDLTQVILVATLQRETGGNTAEILDRVAETIRERQALRRFVKTLTAQGRLTRWIVSALPVALAVIISVLAPDYLHPLWHTSTGHALILLAIVLLVSGSLVIRRIVDIEV